MRGQRGRKIDTWGIRVDGVCHEVPVYMKSGRDGTFFSVYLTSPTETLSDDNIDALKTKATSAVAHRVGLEWEKFIYVTYSGGSDQPYGDDLDAAWTVKSNLRYEIVEVATLGDGTKTHRFLDRHKGRNYAYEGLPETGINESFSDEDPEATALIPFTPENMEALQSIRDRFIALNEVLRERLAPESIQKTLAQVADLAFPRLTHETKPRKARSK